MGAYENPPMISFQTTGAGQAWANAAASIGKNIGDAVVKRQKYLDDKLEKENKEMLALRKQRNALAAKGADLLKANLEKMKGLDKEFQQAYAKEFKAGWEIYTKSQTSTDLDEIEALQPQLDKFNHFKANASNQIQNANDYTIKMAKFIDQVAIDGPGVPNTVDLYYAGNNNLMKAANIETGGITDGESREVIINDKGNAVMRYTFVNEEGKSETFDLDTAELDLDNVLQVPDLNKLAMATINAGNLFNEDGKLNSSYTPIDPDTNQPELEIKTITKGNKLITIQNQKVDADAIEKQFVNAGRDAVANLSYEQKISIWKNTIAPSLNGYEPEDLSYDSTTGQLEGAAAAKFNAGLGAYMGEMARTKVAEATADNYKVTTSNKPTDSEGRLMTTEEVLDETFKYGAETVKEAGENNTEPVRVYQKAGSNTYMEAIAEIPENDKTGWFKNDGLYYRIIAPKRIGDNTILTAVENIPNAKIAKQYFGGRPKLQ